MKLVYSLILFILIIGPVGFSKNAFGISPQAPYRPSITKPPSKPPPQIEKIPPKPFPGAYWKQGYWEYSEYKWLWINGYWQSRQKNKNRYVPAHWEKTSTGRKWVPAHWE